MSIQSLQLQFLFNGLKINALKITNLALLLLAELLSLQQR